MEVLLVEAASEESILRAVFGGLGAADPHLCANGALERRRPSAMGTSEVTHVGSPSGGSSSGWPRVVRTVVFPDPALPQTHTSEKPSAGNAGKPRSSSTKPRIDPANPETNESKRSCSRVSSSQAAVARSAA